MKCKMTEKKNMQIMLAVGAAMMIIGAAAGYLLPQEAHWQTKLAGVLNGMGFSFVVMAGAVLVRRARLGEKGANDSELTMTDERGMMVAYKAQNVAAIVAILGVVAIMMTALLRGDTLYMTLCMVLCFAVGAVKFIALYLYNKMM